jgi:hypothetical protein
MKTTKENKNKKRTSTSKSTPSKKVNKSDQEKEFPGYPLYSPEEDIMNKNQRVDLNLDETDSAEHMNDEYSKKTRRARTEDPIISNTSEVTKEDLEALGPKDLSLDMGDDENLLKHRVHPVDFAAQDLDIPEEDNKTIEDGGTGDEENNFYSLGGDAHENLEEDQS